MKASTCKCGGSIKIDKCLIEGFLVECMKCDKCGETLFTPEQTNQLIRLREANKEIEGKRKIVKVGSSMQHYCQRKLKLMELKRALLTVLRF